MPHLEIQFLREGEFDFCQKETNLNLFLKGLMLQKSHKTDCSNQGSPGTSQLSLPCTLRLQEMPVISYHSPGSYDLS